jgi:enolase-phosphatase E1
VKGVLLDVEGTTTPSDFVVRVLFPYARARIEAFLRAHSGEVEVARDVEALREEHTRDAREGRNPPPWDESPAGVALYARRLMDEDRKATPLKSLQGRIWAAGYAAGELQGQVYEDVPRALRRWAGGGRAVAIFSSGSVLAQRLLFAHSDHGDLTPHIAAYFDTLAGPKGDAASYGRIAEALRLPTGDLLFVSDALHELDAARAAGLPTALAVRGSPLPATSRHPPVGSFDDLG